MSDIAEATYLEPYQDAVRRHGASFPALLWASPQTQAARFDAMARLFNFTGARLLDAGCGRADLLDWLVAHGQAPAEYVGLEAVPELASAARSKRHPNAVVVQADFVREPARLLVGADVVVFCGSLNTLDAETFHSTLAAGWKAAGRALLFNFLSSARLAAASWLTWHATKQVTESVRSLGARFAMLDDYMQGDCTVLLQKE